MNLLRYSIFLVGLFFLGCKWVKPGAAAINPEVNSDQEQVNIINGLNIDAGQGALLLTRFNSFDAFKQVVKIEYFNRDGNGYFFDRSKVRLTHVSAGRTVISELCTGVNELDFLNAQDGGYYERLWLILISPYAIWVRKDLRRAFALSRRREVTFGEGDIAFYDLAARMMYGINTEDRRLMQPEDLTEQGYLNTFLHVTTQAFITSIFSEKLADFIADAHERRYIPELVDGKFSQKQIDDLANGATDNYLDLINNEWGQELGKTLRKKYAITRRTVWTDKLLADYLNDVQRYFGWAFQVGFKPFHPEDELVVRFAQKLNSVMNKTPLVR